ncbi:MAG TPA: PAS domain-containing sensor histidine kinase [Gammaproteobacteria bacterium]|nr:PAS domain-containing sensor histidine kinase [Gammaproteobacteria bacterium]
MNMYSHNIFSHLNQSLHILAKFLPGHIYWKDLNGAFLGCNTIQAQSAGLSVAEMLGKTDYEMPWKAQADALRKADLEIMKNGLPTLIEESSLLSDGKIHFFLSNKIPLFDEEEKCIGLLGISLDITEQKHKELALEKQISQTKITLDTLLDNIPAHVFWKDTNCNLLGCNDLQAKNMGFYSAKEMVGMSNYDVINPNQSETDRKAQAEAITRLDKEVMSTGKTYTAEEPLVLSNGEIAIFLSKKSPLRNRQGEIIGVLGISSDITELKKTQKKLKLTKHKLTAMTAISTIIAHELRTPLASLELASSNLDKYIPTLIKSYHLAQEANLPIDYIPPQKINLFKDTITRMRAEIRSAFMFIDMLLVKLRTSISAKSSECFTMSQCIEDILNRYPFQPREKEIVFVKINHDFNVQANKLFVVHMFFNLIKNALYHAAKDHTDKITILLDTNSEYNIVIFKDTGSGIPKDILPKIFKRFFSKTYHGTGVGLTFCKTVMKSLGGDITCNSELGQYTEFVLSFPKQFQTHQESKP